ARKRDDLANIFKLIRDPNNGNYVIDDFHRLPDHFKNELSNMAKIAADEGKTSNYPKLVIIGINQTGSDLLSLSPDIAKRCGIHKVRSGTEEQVNEIIEKGEELLNITFFRPKAIYNETKGDYWLTQLICQTICVKNKVLNTQIENNILTANMKDIRKSIVDRMENTYQNVVKEFCRGKRFRPTNNAYIKFLEIASKFESFPVDLNELSANGNEEIKIAINSIKDHRLSVHIKDKDILSNNFYYNSETKMFNIEDPALQYYIKHIDWKKLYKECGFVKNKYSYVFDIAISFAGENRELAQEIATTLKLFDYEVFYDEHYEANYLGSSWSKEFQRIFSTDSKYVICLLDINHKNKIWPTFERECFID
ncbi:MAG: TIR domain-containing protein, partial [Rickettsiales bacterium]